MLSLPGINAGPSAARRLCDGHEAVILDPERMLVKYKIALRKSDEGFSVSVPGLPGCRSQGQTEEEALTNIQDAIREYLAVVAEQRHGADIREIDVAV